MRAVEHYVKNVVTVPSAAPAPEIADAMRDQGVGCVIVVAEDGHPVGIVTDRDLTLRVIAEGRMAGQTPASAIMSHPLRTVNPELPLDEVVEILRSNGVRRLPVVRGQELMGLVALDDLLAALADELAELGAATRHEIQDAQRRARVQQARSEAREKVEDWVGRLEKMGVEAKESLLKELASIRERLKERLR